MHVSMCVVCVEAILEAAGSTAAAAGLFSVYLCVCVCIYAFMHVSCVHVCMYTTMRVVCVEAPLEAAGFVAAAAGPFSVYVCMYVFMYVCMLPHASVVNI